MAHKQSSRRIPPEPPAPPERPSLAEQPSRFMQLEREVEQEYRPQMLAALQRKVDAVSVEAGSRAPDCPQCGRPMGHHDTRPATVARLVNASAGLCWRCWEWNRAASADRWPVC